MLTFTSRGQTHHFDKPLVMGILNVTPDSFFDGGRFDSKQTAVQRIEQMVEQGADIIDIGAESTRPDAEAINSSEQIKRLGNLIGNVKQNFDVLVSIDTSDAEVIRMAADQGVDIVNDVRALQQPNALNSVAANDLAVVLMHMQGQPDTMQHNPSYDDVVHQVGMFFKQRIDAVTDTGIKPTNIILDPGFGFGKTLQQNAVLLANLKLIGNQSNGQFPMLVGLSRKSMIEKITGAAVDKRLAGSLCLAIKALHNGAQILRVHDIIETRQVVDIWQYISQFE